MEYKRASRKPVKKSRVIGTRLLTIAVVLGVVGFAGYKIGFHYLSNKMMNEMAGQILTTEEVEALKQDPAVQKIIADNSKYFDKEAVEAIQGSIPAASNGSDNDTKQSGKTDSTSADHSNGTKEETKPSDKPSKNDELVVKTKDEAADLLLSKFSMKELTGLADEAKDGLTTEEKQSIKETLLGRLSTEEYNSVKIIALMEMMKSDE